MASFKFCFLSVVICSVLVVAKGELPPTEAPKIIALSTTEPTKAPTSTDVPTTEATTEPTTELTTVKPNTTTSSTTTTTTTTPPPPPPTPTPAPPAPSPAPPAPGPPQQGTWSYKDEKNVTCVLLQFAGQLNVTYPMTVNKTTAIGVLLMNIPANATASSGACGAAQHIVLSWPATVDKDHTLTVHFQKNDTTKSYEVKAINVTLVPSVFPNISNVDSIELYHGAEWPTPLAASYRCAAATRLTMTSEAVNIASTLTLTQLQEEAYRTAAGKGFSAPRDCAGGDIPDAVPIAVGCALGGMVLVVLVAYLVARRRSAARGYLSM